MRMLTATAIVAVAALGGPTATGQSQRIPIPVVAAAGETQAAAKAASMLPASLALRDFERSPSASGGKGLASVAPNSTVSWLMALGFLGLVVMRRTRSFF